MIKTFSIRTFCWMNKTQRLVRGHHAGRASHAFSYGAALQYLSVAARPGINIGDAIEALVETDKALQLASDNPVIAAAQHNLRAILNDLHNRRYGYSAASRTPLPTLSLPH
jgi:hypothetical protein